MMIKAIETSFKGYRFRSRLEARWAVFFEALEIDWEYEKQGYEVAPGLHYLPDFRIRHPLASTEIIWCEIKGDEHIVYDRDKEKMIRFSGAPLPDDMTDLISGKVLGRYNQLYLLIGVPGEEILKLAAPQTHDFTDVGQWAWEQYGATRTELWASFVAKDTTDIYRAYAIARSARFEFGEQPRFNK